MSKFLDPLGLIAGTWNWMGEHGGGGFAALVAAVLMLILHLIVVAGVICLVINPGRILEAGRGFAQGMHDDSPPGGPGN
jgi:hypothetical protein